MTMTIHTSFIKIVFQELPTKTESELREIANNLVASSSSSPSAPLLGGGGLLTIGGLALIHIA